MIDLKQHAQRLKTQLPAVYLCMKDPETPAIAKLTAGAAVVYALSPIDLIPDFIPVLGYLDDILLLPLLIALTLRLIPQDIWQRNLQAAEGLWQDGKPKKWYYAAPVFIFWAVILWLILRAVF